MFAYLQAIGAWYEEACTLLSLHALAVAKKAAKGELGQAPMSVLCKKGVGRCKVKT